MRCVPGISWGYDAKVNLVEENGIFRAMYYDGPESEPDLIAEFAPKNGYEHSRMMEKMTLYNYNTCALCPVVKAEIDWTC